MNLYHRYYFEIVGEPIEPQWVHPECLFSGYCFAVNEDEARRKAYDNFLEYLPEVANGYYWWTTIEEVKA